MEYQTWKKIIKLTEDYLSIGLMGLFEQNTSSSMILIKKRVWPKQLGLTFIHAKYCNELTQSFYLNNFIRVAENLPIAISICSVQKGESVSFPIIYVNEMYGLMTGHNRSEVLGENFADAKKCNRDLYEHLLHAKPYMTKLRNHDNHNINRVYPQYLVGVRPISDCNNKYLYVIVIHMDIACESEFDKGTLLMHNLISKLPRRLTVLEFKRCPISSVDNTTIPLN